MSRSRNAPPPATAAEANPQATRETVESIAVAIILAFLFRSFVAEAFVIPTGSMAPTLQGRHVDLTCPQCSYQYRTGASMENERRDIVEGATCPVCHYPVALDRTSPDSWLQTNQDSFNGDRILVSKFSYELADPKRWDVIVFKYPGNAKQNYIKRLIGLPGETVLIKNGDIFVAPTDQNPGPDDFEIARKPASKVKAMLQLVDDTRYIGDLLREVDWPSRWSDDQGAWEVSANNQQFRVTADEQTAWLHYKHLVPRVEDWEHINLHNELPEEVGTTYQGHLITDYYAYNDYQPKPMHDRYSSYGSCWVGDLSLEADIHFESDTGELWLELVEGGVRFRCRFDIASGQAELSIEDGSGTFDGEPGEGAQRPTAETTIGPGRHRVQFANVDDELHLWVDSKLVTFDQPTTFVGNGSPIPAWTEDDPGDLAPLAIGGRNAAIEVTRLKVWRDLYYQAVAGNPGTEYVPPPQFGEVEHVFSNPHEWTTSRLFQNRNSVVFPLGENQFFPLGDNSPQSKDARLWSEAGGPEHFVERKLLLGKAVVIYWPHAWRPLLPNFTRMGLIR